MDGIECVVEESKRRKWVLFPMRIDILFIPSRLFCPYGLKVIFSVLVPILLSYARFWWGALIAE
jgi:hypothetical protein